MRRIPKHVLRANRARAEGEAMARFYGDPKTLAYAVDDGRGPVPIDLFTWTSTTMLQLLTPRDRRMISELGPGETLELYGVTLHCSVGVPNATV